MPESEALSILSMFNIIIVFMPFERFLKISLGRTQSHDTQHRDGKKSLDDVNRAKQISRKIGRHRSLQSGK